MWHSRGQSLIRVWWLYVCLAIGRLSHGLRISVVFCNTMESPCTQNAHISCVRWQRSTSAICILFSSEPSPMCVLYWVIHFSFFQSFLEQAKWEYQWMTRGCSSPTLLKLLLSKETTPVTLSSPQTWGTSPGQLGSWCTLPICTPSITASGSCLACSHVTQLGDLVFYFHFV